MIIDNQAYKNFWETIVNRNYVYQIWNQFKEMIPKEKALLKERRKLVFWCRSTERVNLKIAIRQEIAKIDKELRKLA